MTNKLCSHFKCLPFKISFQIAREIFEAFPSGESPRLDEGGPLRLSLDRRSVPRLADADLWSSVLRRFTLRSAAYSIGSMDLSRSSDQMLDGMKNLAGTLST